MRKRTHAMTVVGIGATVAALAPAALAVARPEPPQGPAQMAPVLKYRVVATYPHDPSAYTQGLVYKDGFLFESTGRNGASTLRRVKLETGEVLQRIPIDAKYFAEGLADVGTELVQLTWQSNIGFVYDLKTFKLNRTFTYTGEGWGLVNDGTRLIMSDGTPALRFLEPKTLREIGRVTVTDGGLPVEDLNELEMMKGEILANIYQTDYIVTIAPRTGRVTGRIDLRGLLPAADRLRQVDVLNGIAYDPVRDRLFVTGKWWPKLFEIRVVR
jgi:glutaminyl-peptide cyclotransferase